MEFDYTFFYKKKYTDLSRFFKENSWSLIISAFNDSTRVKEVFSKVQAKNKNWLILPEYNYLQGISPKWRNI